LIDQGFDPPPPPLLLFFFRRTVTKTAMMTMTMMMRTVERNASIYPKLEKLQEKVSPLNRSRKQDKHISQESATQNVKQITKEKKARKNKHIKVIIDPVILSVCASPKPRLLPHTVDLRDHQCDNDDCNDDENYNPGLKRTMLGQNFPQYSERNT
jgi:hypothetical protein